MFNNAIALDSLVGRTITKVDEIIDTFVLTLDDGRMISFEYDPGYYYSEYTHDPGSFSITDVTPRGEDV